jgi:anaerobic magnesium-protoporphyrin IX monomethyl ester cyclase
MGRIKMVEVLIAHKRHPIEPLGVGYISSSIARGGHRAKMILTNGSARESAELVNKELSSGKYRVFGQSIIFGSHLYGAEVSRNVKMANPGIVSVLGGPAATFTPELLERGFDAIVRYEGEGPFLEFCNALESGKDVGNIPNMWVKANPDLYRTEIRNLKKVTDIDDPKYKDESGFDEDRMRFVNAPRRLLEGADLDAVPHPDRKILYDHPIFANGPIFHFMYTRGCAFRCTYCFEHVQHGEMKGKGQTVRRRAIDDFVNEVNGVRDMVGDKMKVVYLQDDVAGMSYKFDGAKEFADVYSKEVGLPMHIHTRLDLIARDPRIAEELARAGVTGAHVAIEAGNNYIRNDVHRRDMSTEQVREGSAALKANGVRLMTQNILGAPGESWDNMMETLDLNIDVGPTFASASVFQPYPGTTALEIAKAQGVMPARSLNELTDAFEMESFYDGSILALEPEFKHKISVLQRYFALAVHDPKLRRSGELDRLIASHPEGDKEADEKLALMYRTHRKQQDEVLYGVKLGEAVGVHDEDD